MITVNNLYKEFNTGFSLKNINMVIPTGEKIKIFGPNGAGKTTFLRILACLIKPTHGSFTVFGYPHTKRVEILKQMGLAAQSGHFYEALTVNQNLQFYGKLYGLSQVELSLRIDQLLKQFNLSEKVNLKVAQLSKGMKQRLVIIKALLHDPEILLLDEPYSGLDIDSAQDLKDFLNSLTDKTIITATHDFDLGTDDSDRIIIFDNGSIVFDGQWKENNISFKKFYKVVVGK